MKTLVNLSILTVSFLCLVFLTGCYHNDFTVTKSTDINRQVTNYSDPISAACLFDNFENNKWITKEEKTMLQVAKHIRTTNIREANILLTELLSSSNEKIKNLATLFSQITYSQIDSLNNDKANFRIINNKSYPIVVKDKCAYIKTEIGNKQYLFLIDNGYSSSAVGSRIMNEIKSDIKDFGSSIQTVDINKKNNLNKLFKLNNIKIANISIDNLLFIADEQREDGIIGWDILSQFDVRIDFKKQEIVFLQSDSAEKDTNHYYSWAGVPLLFATDCDGIQSVFVLDLGGNVSFITENYFNWHGTEKKIVDTIRRRFVSSMGSSERYSLDIVSNLCFNIGGYNFHFNKLMLNNYMLMLTPIEGYLASDLWQNGRIRLDYKNGIFKYEE